MWLFWATLPFSPACVIVNAYKQRSDAVEFYIKLRNGPSLAAIENGEVVLTRKREEAVTFNDPYQGYAFIRNNRLRDWDVAMTFASIDDVRTHRWEGNAFGDGPAFKAITEFVKRDDVTLDDKYEALDLMGTNGMGLDPIAVEHPEMSKQDVLDEYLKDCD